MEKFHLYINCETCGEPLSLNDPKFGLDCKNECSKKAFQAMLESFPGIDEIYGNVNKED